jgi:Family of unknown function (DUF6065)
MFSPPEIRFICLIDPPMTPRPALRDAAGTLPMRAARYCEAVTAACGFGWWIYPPVDALLLWDGRAVSCSFDGRTWEPIDDTVPFPCLGERLAEHAPPDIRPLAPTLFQCPPEAGGNIQVNLGVIAQTSPGWSMLLRRPANLHIHPAFDHFEGIVETDRWCGPLFINLRLTRTHTPIRLNAMFPLVQAQPIPKILYGLDAMKAVRVESIADMTRVDWAAWHQTFVEPDSRPERRVGEYAAASRKRRRGQCSLGTA